VRKARFAWERGYVRFYSKREFIACAIEAGARRERISMINLGRDWIAVIRP
jgi:hypothetical protein